MVGNSPMYVSPSILRENVLVLMTSSTTGAPRVLDLASPSTLSGSGSWPAARSSSSIPCACFTRPGNSTLASIAAGVLVVGTVMGSAAAAPIQCSSGATWPGLHAMQSRGSRGRRKGKLQLPLHAGQRLWRGDDAEAPPALEGGVCEDAVARVGDAIRRVCPWCPVGRVEVLSYDFVDGRWTLRLTALEDGRRAGLGMAALTV
ncbi:hypothetical protein PspLS_05900 [Pyricularia sp. CBS 133598]|nr:hypothetical protein PspLS_05900 [Pyricularia sp. CBS 133598]